jgi:signal peptidase I
VQSRQEELLNGSATALVQEAVRRFGAARLKAQGTSMVPAVRPGDVLTIQRRAITELVLGDVVVFARGGRLFAHRVVELVSTAAGALTVIARGDAHRRSDPPVTMTEVVGVVVALTRGGRQLHEPFAYSPWAAHARRFAMVLRMTAVRVARARVTRQFCRFPRACGRV